MAATVEQRLAREAAVLRARLEAERAALEQQHARYRDLFELAPDAYLVTDGDGMIIEANRAASRLFDVRHRFLVAKPLASFVAVGERRAFRRDLIELKRTPRTSPTAPSRTSCRAY